MRVRPTHDSSSAAQRLGAVPIFLIFLGWTAFSVFVYSRYSQLGDASSYLTGEYGEDAQARTLLITMIATQLISLLRSDLLAHLAFSLFVASGVYYLARQARIEGRYRWPLLAILLNPNFGVWASVVGRESMFVALLAFFMGAVVGFHRDRGLHRFLLALLCVVGMVFIRAPFGLGVALFFLLFLAISLGPRTRLSLGVQALMLTLVGLFALMLVWPYVDAYIAEEVLPTARSYFTVNSTTTRTWVDIGTTGEFFRSLPWTLPLALVGPTPAEAMARPVMLPFLLAGLAVLGTLLYSIRVAFRSPAGPMRKILLLGWLPAILVILVSYVPFGIYNPGSGIRYASCFVLFLVFPSMLRAGLRPMVGQAGGPPPPLPDIQRPVRYSTMQRIR